MNGRRFTVKQIPVKRRRRAYRDARDFREIIHVGGREFTCAEYKAQIANHTMAAHDNIPADWRVLVAEFGVLVNMLLQHPAARKLPAAQAREILVKFSQQKSGLP